jgi:uncharacterized protein (DUF433 family)
MPFRFDADPPPLCQTEDGVIRVKDTRIPLERIVRAFLAGSTPEQIVQDYDVLTIEDAYAVINYYLHHRDEIDAYLANAAQESTNTREEIENAWDPTGIRARLAARRPAKAG